jgi:hypothetical protein
MCSLDLHTSNITNDIRFIVGQVQEKFKTEIKKLIYALWTYKKLCQSGEASCAKGFIHSRSGGVVSKSSDANV